MNAIFIIWGLSYLGVAILEFKDTIAEINKLPNKLWYGVFVIVLVITHIVFLPFAPIILIGDIYTELKNKK